jgi:hypothetical protein
MGILKGSPAKSASGSAQQWAQPYATQGAQSVIDVFNAAQPQTQANLGQINATNANLAAMGKQFGQQSAAMGQQAAAMGKTAGSANSFYNDVINGKYMSGNPYIQNMLGQLDQSILGQVGSQFESGGRYGSGAYVDDLSKQLGNANMQVLYGNYADEMNRRMQAGQQADSALAAQQSALNNSEQVQNANAQQQLAGLQLANQAPYTGINALGNSLGALFNGGTSTGQTPGLLGAVGAIGAGLASNPSLFA